MPRSISVSPEFSPGTSYGQEVLDFRFNQAPSESLFLGLRDAYEPYGGIAWGEDLDGLLSSRGSDLSAQSLARLMVAGYVFYFEWQGAKWIPMVQFHPADLSLNLLVRRIRRELGDQLDGWEVANWFVRPNEGLDGRRPIELIESELAAVLQAARADRFVMSGG